MRRVPQLKWAAVHIDVLGRPFFAKSKTKLMGGQPELAVAVGVSTASKLLSPKNFLLAGHLNQTLALWPKGG